MQRNIISVIDFNFENVTCILFLAF